MISHLNRSPSVHFIRIMSIVEIAKLNWYDRLVKGHPLIHQVTVAFKAETSIVYISMDCI